MTVPTPNKKMLGKRKTMCTHERSAISYQNTQKLLSLLETFLVRENNSAFWRASSWMRVDPGKESFPLSSSDASDISSLLQSGAGYSLRGTAQTQRSEIPKMWSRPACLPWEASSCWVTADEVASEGGGQIDSSCWAQGRAVARNAQPGQARHSSSFPTKGKAKYELCLQPEPERRKNVIVPSVRGFRGTLGQKVPCAHCHFISGPVLRKSESCPLRRGFRMGPQFLRESFRLDSCFPPPPNPSSWPSSNSS